MAASVRHNDAVTIALADSAVRVHVDAAADHPFSEVKAPRASDGARRRLSALVSALGPVGA